jgi:hypothetical protein
MLPAAELTEILANLSALNLQPTTAAQILAAVLAPLLRSDRKSEPSTVKNSDLARKRRAERPRRRPRRAASSKPRASSQRAQGGCL